MWENFARFGFQKISKYLSARQYTAIIQLSNMSALTTGCR